MEQDIARALARVALGTLVTLLLIAFVGKLRASDEWRKNSIIFAVGVGITIALLAAVLLFGLLVSLAFS